MTPWKNNINTINYYHMHTTKCFSAVLFAALLTAGQPAGAQSTFDTDANTVIVTPMQLCTGRTTVIILAAPIADNGVDRGSAFIHAKAVDGIGNVIKVKATSDSLRPTNLTIFTRDGRVYRFEVEYHADPVRDFFDFSHTPASAASAGVLFTAERINDAAVQKTTDFVRDLSAHRSRPRAQQSGQMRMRVLGVYLSGGVLFFQIGLSNRSGVPYKLDFIRCYQRDRRQKKRTSQMEKEMTVLATSYKESKPTIEGNGATHSIVVALDKFTIADSKYFMIEAFEQNGDRHLQVKIQGKDILKAKALLSR